MSVPGAGVAETHAAIVVFVGDRAYKLKKPVDLGFLDFRRREDREAACHQEVSLNRRLAPDVYLGVADVLGSDGQPADHLVIMRRMPADRRLSTLVQAGDDVDDHLWHLAHLLAAFHARAARSPAADEAASRDALAGRWSTNTSEMLGASGQFLDVGAIEAVDDLAHRYLAGRGPLFERRIAEGRACDGHGDLLADDIFCLDDGPRVLDCIEFDVRLRLDDALADVAFLAMDLERLGRSDLAERFLAAYREHADDTWPPSLAHHHVAYRAQVRAKVAAIRAMQGDQGSVAEARRLLHRGRRHMRSTWRAARPLVSPTPWLPSALRHCRPTGATPEAPTGRSMSPGRQGPVSGGTASLGRPACTTSTWPMRARAPTSSGSTRTPGSRRPTGAGSSWPTMSGSSTTTGAGPGKTPQRRSPIGALMAARRLSRGSRGDTR